MHDDIRELEKLASLEWKALDRINRKLIIDRAVKMHIQIPQEQQEPQQGSPKRLLSPTGSTDHKGQQVLVDDEGKVIKVGGLQLHLANNLSGYKGVTPSGSKWIASSRHRL